MEELKTIIIDGKEYDLSMFSPQVSKLAQIIVRWENEANDKRIEVAKCEAALREANREITDLVKKELNL